MSFTFHVPPRCQGQTVEYAYGMWMGVVYRRITDRSIGPDRPGRVTYAQSQARLDDEGDYWNGEPSNRRWRTISEAELARAIEA